MSDTPAWLRRVARELATPVDVDVHARDRLSRRLRGVDRAHGRGAPWLLRRQRMAMTPLAAATVAAVLVGAGAVGGVLLDRTAGSHPAAAAAVAAAPARGELVSFLFVSTEARSVVLVGDFNGWRVDATPLVRAGEPGTWTVAVPLAPGRYTYSFVVDGTEWRPDPAAPPAPGEGFGRPSSLVFVEDCT